MSSAIITATSTIDRTVVTERPDRAEALPPVIRQMFRDREQGINPLIVAGMSCNPIHLGHVSYLNALLAKVNQLGLQLVNRLVLIPAKVNPQKEDKVQLSPEHKDEMVKAAIRSYPAITADTQELYRAGSSYWWKTIENIGKILKGEITQTKEGEITGDTLDAYKGLTKEKTRTYMVLTTESVGGDGKKAGGFYTWAEPDFIVDNATIIYGNRKGTQFDRVKLRNTMLKINEMVKSGEYIVQMEEKPSTTIQVENSQGTKEELIVEFKTLVSLEEKRAAKGRDSAISQKVIDALDFGYLDFEGPDEISSTQINKCIEAGESIDHLVGPEVAAIMARIQAESEKK